jgi:hypothetical protein
MNRLYANLDESQAMRVLKKVPFALRRTRLRLDDGGQKSERVKRSGLRPPTSGRALLFSDLYPNRL